MAKPLHPKAVELWPNAKWTEYDTAWVTETVTTPETAAKLLAEHNNKNRPLTPSRSRYIASLHAKGLWMVTGETMIFDWDMEITSAQNRLRGCQLAGLPFKSFIIVGVDPSSRDWTDHGNSKTVADRMAALGLPNYSALASIVRMVGIWHRTGQCARGGNQKHNMAQAMALLEEHPEIHESVTWTVGHHNSYKFFHGPAATGTLHWMFSRAGKELAEEFLTLVPSNRIPNEPKYDMLSKLNNASTYWKKGVRIEYVMALSIKAWNCFRTGKALQSLVWKDSQGEGFPRPYGWAFDKLGRPTGCGSTKIQHDDEGEAEE